jgi:YVTN family beta-propeller protein
LRSSSPSLFLFSLLSFLIFSPLVGTARAAYSTISVGKSPDFIAFDSANGNLYVTNFNDNTVSVISGQTNKVIGNPIPVGVNPLGIAFDSANGSGAANDVSVISGSTNTVIGSNVANQID